MIQGQEAKYEEAVESCFIDTFGEVKIPNEEVIEIRKISEIPGIAKKIRAHRYGPQLKINGPDKITTQFRAGYHGDPSRYVESLFINFGTNHSYDGMYSLFNPKNEKKSPDSLATLIKQIDLDKLGKNAIFLNTDCMVEALSQPTIKVSRELFQITKPGKLGRDVFTPYFSMNNLHKAAAKPVRQARPSTKIQGDVKGFSDQLLRVAQPTLSDRLLAIWFLAESFRYPPMLFYSLLILHCYMNGYISLDDLKNGFHPQKKGSQQIQFFCYAAGSGYSLEALRAGSAKDDMSEFREANLNILKVLYAKIEEEVGKKFGIDLEQRARGVFKLHVQYYLKLCGMDVERIIQFKGDVY